MTLAAQIVADSMAVFQNTNDFGETISYFPRGGGKPLVIPAVVTERIGTRQDSNSIYDVPVIEVEIAMDPTGVNGLPFRPQRGDTIWRSGNGDDDTVRYGFGGHVLAADGNMWELEFERIEAVQAGAIRSM